MRINFQYGTELFINLNEVFKGEFIKDEFQIFIPKKYIIIGFNFLSIQSK